MKTPAFVLIVLFSTITISQVKQDVNPLFIESNWRITPDALPDLVNKKTNSDILNCAMSCLEGQYRIKPNIDKYIYPAYWNGTKNESNIDLIKCMTGEDGNPPYSNSYHKYTLDFRSIKIYNKYIDVPQKITKQIKMSQVDEVGKNREFTNLVYIVIVADHLRVRTREASSSCHFFVVGRKNNNDCLVCLYQEIIGAHD